MEVCFLPNLNCYLALLGLQVTVMMLTFGSIYLFWWFATYLQGLWVNFAKDQLFCLLGPNGAGKTTTINCLTGITPVTGGDGDTLSLSLSPSLTALSC